MSSPIRAMATGFPGRRAKGAGHRIKEPYEARARWRSPERRYSGARSLAASKGGRTAERRRPVWLTRSCPLIVGNWKMHGLGEAPWRGPDGRRGRRGQTTGGPGGDLSAGHLVGKIGVTVGGDGRSRSADRIARPRGASGAFTGRHLPGDAGRRRRSGSSFWATSERRAGHHESDAMVAAKVTGALRAGLEPVVCVGESLGERQAGLAEATVERQVRASLDAPLTGRMFLGRL